MTDYKELVESIIRESDDPGSFEDRQVLLERCRAAIEALLTRLEWSPDHSWDGIACRDETIRQLEKSRDALRKDAERYRLLRRGQHCSVVNGIGDELRADTLDAAIDAAIEGRKG